MAVVQAFPIAELQTKPKKLESKRALRLHEMEVDAEQVLQAIIAEGAAFIDLHDEDNPSHYISSLKTAIARKGYQNILIRKRKNALAAIAWRMREEDRAGIEAHRRRGLEMGLGKHKNWGRRRRSG